MVGLFFQVVQLAAYGIATSNWYDRILQERNALITDIVVPFKGHVACRWFGRSVIHHVSIDQCIRVCVCQGQPARFDILRSLLSQRTRLLHSGLVQGMVNGVRGLCNGLGPALFGFVFYLFDVNLNYAPPLSASSPSRPIPRSNWTTLNMNTRVMHSSMLTRDVPGPPFLFGALLATVSLMFSLLLPNSKGENYGTANDTRTIEHKARLLTVDEESNDNVQLD